MKHHAIYRAETNPIDFKFQYLCFIYMFDEYARICIFDGSGSGDANWLSDFFLFPN